MEKVVEDNGNGEGGGGMLEWRRWQSTDGIEKVLEDGWNGEGDD